MANKKYNSYIRLTADERIERLKVPVAFSPQDVAYKYRNSTIVYNSGPNLYFRIDRNEPRWTMLIYEPKEARDFFGKHNTYNKDRG